MEQELIRGGGDSNSPSSDSSGETALQTVMENSNVAVNQTVMPLNK